MIPRAVQMAAEVANTLTVSELNDYGNIILNGYATTGPNTINKKAWQYKETLTPPVNLPSLTSVRPALKGWTNNYQEYYTQLQPNGYGVNPGDPTMFEYSVHSYTQETGPITTFSWVSPGSGYTPGTYLAVPLTGGAGVGATANFVIAAGATGGPVTAASFVSGGTGYPVGTTFFTNTGTTTLTGYGTGLRLSGTTEDRQLASIDGIDVAGNNYEVGDTFDVNPGTGTGRVDAISPNGSVIGFTLVNPGTGFYPGDVLQAPSLPGGAGFDALVDTVNPVSGTGNVPRWAQAPRRLINSTVSPFVPPNTNQQAIQYSAILYPVSDNPLAPPIDTL